MEQVSAATEDALNSALDHRDCRSDHMAAYFIECVDTTV